jgi:two-component system phosphate regulon response regulator OmpR
MTQKNHLLIVDDDERLRNLLSQFVLESGFEVTSAASAAEAQELLSFFKFDLIVLDVMMPGESGLDYACRVRKEGLKTPILFLTALGETEDKIKGLEAGADDYLPKPFEPKELLLRIQAILRRSDMQDPGAHKKEVQIGPFHFNLEKESLRRGDIQIPLTSGESNLLKIFVSHVGSYLTREQLIEFMNLEATSRTVDVQITRLRKKIEENPRQPNFLQTVRNKGYVLWDH